MPGGATAAPEMDIGTLMKASSTTASVIDGPLIEALRVALNTTLSAMDPDWDRRFLAARELSEAVPALQAHSLGYCHDTTLALVNVVSGRADVDEVRVRLAVEIFVAAWRTASLRWTVQGGHGGRDALLNLGRVSGCDQFVGFACPSWPDPVDRRV